MALALKYCQKALKNYNLPLPLFSEDIKLCFRHWTEFNDRTHLSNKDYLFMCQVGEYLINASKEVSFSLQPLHGDPHVGNFLNTREGVLLCDFESVCIGPLEWDLSSLPTDIVRFYNADIKILEMMRNLRSWLVAAWCWMYLGQSKEKEAAAMHHLNWLKEKAIL